jgi:FHS family L-fucose permease-like MFS transporter
MQDPDADKKKDHIVYEKSPWAFRHFALGAIAIFVYVGVEAGIFARWQVHTSTLKIILPLP